MKTLKQIQLKATKKSIIPNEVFTGYLSSEFTNTQEEVVSRTFIVFEMTEDATFKQLFTQPDKQVMTIGEITEFCKNHKDDLRQDGYATFFLFKNRNDFFVACVDVHDGGRLDVYVYPLSYAYVWDAVCRRRVVVPQLILSPLESESLCPSDTLTLKNDVCECERCETCGKRIIK